MTSFTPHQSAYFGSLADPEWPYSRTRSQRTMALGTGGHEPASDRGACFALKSPLAKGVPAG